MYSPPNTGPRPLALVHSHSRLAFVHSGPDQIAAHGPRDLVGLVHVALVGILTLGVRVVLAVVRVGHGGNEGAVALPVSRYVHPSPADDAHVGVARHHLAKVVKDKGQRAGVILQ